MQGMSENRTQRGRTGLWAVLALLALSSACGSAASEVTDSNQPEAVSKADYDRAFEEFRTCVDEGGGRLMNVEVHPEFGTYYYDYADEDVTVVDQCYVSDFQHAQIGYESNNDALLQADAEQNEQEWDTIVFPCLAANGYSVPDSFEAARSDLSSEELRELYRVFVEDLLPVGACS